MDDKRLTLKRYRTIEFERVHAYGPAIVNGFRPPLFEQNAYNMPSDAYLKHFADPFGINESRLFPIDTIVSSRSEADLLNQVIHRTRSLINEVSGETWAPLSSILAMLPLARYLLSLSAKLRLKPLRLYEVGPGSGYLGALMAASGNFCISHEITPSFYVWQNWLYRHLFADNFQETAELDSLSGFPDKPIVHFPWWHHLDAINSDDSNWRVDVVVSRAMLAEMTDLSRSYLIERSLRMLRDSKAGLFIFDSIGSFAFSNMKSIHEELIEHDFRSLSTRDLVLNGSRMFRPLSVYAAPGTPLHEFGSTESMNDAPAKMLQGVGPNVVPVQSGETAVAPLSELLNFEPDWLHPDNRFFEFLGRTTPRATLLQRKSQ